MSVQSRIDRDTALWISIVTTTGKGCDKGFIMVLDLGYIAIRSRYSNGMRIVRSDDVDRRVSAHRQCMGQGSERIYCRGKFNQQHFVAPELRLARMNHPQDSMRLATAVFAKGQI
jgi:hypothetical protein